MHFGEVGMLLDRCTASATAYTAVKLWKVPRERFDELVRESPAFVLAMAGSLAALYDDRLRSSVGASASAPAAAWKARPPRREPTAPGEPQHRTLVALAIAATIPLFTLWAPPPSRLTPQGWRVILTILGAAVGWLLAYLGGPDIVRGWIEAVAGDNRIIIMYLMVIVLTIAGDFLDGVPAIAIFMPIIVALIKLAHINPVHMGVLIIVSLAFGLITPPYGLILLLSSTLAGVPFTRALRQSVPLYGIFFLVISLIIFFPNVVLWLPRLVIPTSVGCFPNPSGSGFICPPN